MRLGLAVVGAAAVIGGYFLVNAVASRPAPADEAASAAQAEAGWRPGPIEEAEAEIRSYELIRYVNADGSFGMTDDPRRVPPGAKITGRERRTVARAKPEAAAAEAPEGWPPLPPAGERRAPSAAERRVMEKLLQTGPFPDAGQLDEMQGDLDELESERRAAGAGDEWGTAVPR
jgi:hypothetical protein